LTFRAGSWVTEPSASLGGPTDWAFKTNMGLAAATPTPVPAPTPVPTAHRPSGRPRPQQPNDCAHRDADRGRHSDGYADLNPNRDRHIGSGGSDRGRDASRRLGLGRGLGIGSSGSSDMTIPIIGALILVLLVWVLAASC